MSKYLGFVEVHIEQGPVLNEIDLPLGTVTSINVVPGRCKFSLDIRATTNEVRDK
jgi:acetylornithine deacetylase/succinyl-diaminopimelate desuccinylase-like protein